MTEAALSSAHDGATSETHRRWLGINGVNSSAECRFALVKGEQECTHAQGTARRQVERNST
jgi:hypothetical protein